MKPQISAHRLREKISYDKVTGLFQRIRQPSKAGRGTNAWIKCRKAEAGHKRWDGYVIIGIDRHGYLAHRLAWLYVHGEWPKGEIDHIDGNKSNNRIDNLRDVAHSVNLENRRSAQTNSKTGFLGVAQCGSRYMARLKIRGKPTYLGSFDTAKAASFAYLKMKRKLHSGCTL